MQCGEEKQGRREGGQESRSVGWCEGCQREGVRKGGRDEDRSEEGRAVGGRERVGEKRSEKWRVYRRI